MHAVDKFRETLKKKSEKIVVWRWEKKNYTSSGMWGLPRSSTVRGATGDPVKQKIRVYSVHVRNTIPMPA